MRGRLPAAKRAFAGKREHFSRASIARSGSPAWAATPVQNLDRRRAVEGIFLDRHRGHGALGKGERGFLVVQAHRAQARSKRRL